MIYFAWIDFGVFEPIYSTSWGGPARELGFVKIGCAVDVRRRLRQLELEYGYPLSLLAVLPGEREDEVAWHRRFDHLRLDTGRGNVRPEWFHPTRELMAFIARLGDSEENSVQWTCPGHVHSQ